MPLNIYHSRDQRVRIAVLTAIVSPEDLVTALVPFNEAQPAERCLVSFASAGLFALSHKGMVSAVARACQSELPKDIVLFAPSELSYGVARMLQSGTDLRKMTDLRLERDEGRALARAGLSSPSLRTAVANTRRMG